MILDNLYASLLAIKNGLAPEHSSEQETLDDVLQILKEAMQNNCLAPDLAKPEVPFYQNTHLWQNTSRYAPKIKVKRSGGGISAFDFIDEQFKDPAFSKRYFLFNSSLGKAWSAIKLAKQHREEIRKKAKRQFLYAAKNDTADILLEKLKEAGILSNDYEIRINKIRNRITWDETSEARNEGDSLLIETSKDCLEANLEIHELCKEIKNTVQSTLEKEIFVEQNKMLEINDLCTQLDLTGKRWLDPHFKNPTKLTRLDKFRFALKIFTGAVSALAALAAFVMIFTPLAPLAPLVIMVSMLGMAPMVDTIISTVYCGLRYKRAPLKSQIGELISIPIVAALAFVLVQLTHLSAVLKIIWNGFNKYGSQGLGAILNPIYTAGVAFGFKKATDPRILTKQDLKKQPSIPAKAACEILQKNELSKNGSALKAKASSLPALENIKREGSHSGYNLFFRNTKTGHIDSRKSEHTKLKAWLLNAERNASSPLNPIQIEVRAYLKLDSGSTLEKRHSYIDRLLEEIQSFENDGQNMKTNLAELKTLVNNEKNQLEEIKNNAEPEEEGHIILGA